MYVRHSFIQIYTCTYICILSTFTSFSLLCVVKQFTINIGTGLVIRWPTAYRARSVLRFIAITQKIRHDKSQPELTIEIVTVQCSDFILIYAQINPQLVAPCKGSRCLRKDCPSFWYKKKGGKGETYLLFRVKSRQNNYKYTCSGRSLNHCFISLNQIMHMDKTRVKLSSVTISIKF